MRLWAAGVCWLLLTTPALAQIPILRVNAVWPPVACVESPGVTVWTVQAGDRLEWCAGPAESLADAATSTYVLYLDELRLELAKVLCAMNPDGRVACWAMLPPAAFERLRVLGPHTVEVTRTPRGEGALESARSLPRQLETPGCAEVNLIVSPPVRLPTIVAVGTVLGSRTTVNTLNHAIGVGLLRAAGWRVEQQREQYVAPSPANTSTGGHWYVLAWCVGMPQ